MNRESYEIARDLVQLLIEESVFQINKKAESHEAMQRKKEALEGKKERINKEIKEIRHRAAIVQIRDDMLERVMTELALETVKENLYLSKKIDEKMLDILVRALKLERNSNTNAQDLQILAQNLEDPKLLAAREAIMNLFEEKEVKPEVALTDSRKLTRTKPSSKSGGKSTPTSKTSSTKTPTTTRSALSSKLLVQAVCETSITLYILI